ncbi:MAG TPA: helix-hairpin-helix domain-containing protein [Thermoanaerobaculia bacterium]
MINRTTLLDRRTSPLRGTARAGLFVASALLFVSVGLSADTANAPGAAGGRVNINQASAEQISYLPRIGAKVAARVVDYRKTHGQFARAEDLMEVKGIGEKLFLTLKPYIAVSGPTTLAAKVRLGSSSSRRREASPASEKPPQKSAPASVPAGKGR